MQPPSSWVDALAGCGTNRLGEPEFRMVFSQNRTEKRGTIWTDRDEHGNFLRQVAETREVLKYGRKPRWILERWLSPEMYGSPDSWYEQNVVRDPDTQFPVLGLSALGPYPSRGEYECCFKWETVEGDPLHPNEDMIKCLVHMILHTQGMSEKLKKSAMMETLKRGDDAHKQKVRDMWQEAYEDVKSEVGHRPSRLNDVPIRLGANAPKGLIQLTDEN